VVDDPVDPGVVEFSEPVLEELVLFDLLFLSFEELEELDEFILLSGEDELGFVVSEGVLVPGVDDDVPDVEPGEVALGDELLGDDVPAPGVPGEVVCAIRTPPPRKAPSAGTSKTASCFFIDLAPSERCMIPTPVLLQPLRQCEAARF